MWTVASREHRTEGWSLFLTIVIEEKGRVVHLKSELSWKTLRLINEF